MWMMEEKKPITFSEYLETHQLPVIVDEATKSLIAFWFKYRRIGSLNVDKWEDMFNRNLEYCYPYYYQLLRIDPTIAEYDWFVESYLEREFKHQGNAYSNGSSTVDNTDNSNRTMTDKGTSTTKANGNTTSSNEATNKVKDDRNNFKRDEEYGRVEAYTRANPMSQSYSNSALTSNNGSKLAMRDPVNGTTAESREYRNYFPTPKIQNPTTSADSVTNNGGLHRDESNSTTSTDNKEKGSIKRNDTTTTSHNNTVKNVDKRTTNSNTVNSNNTQDNTLDRLQETGRHQLPSEVINKARNCIENTQAWYWLRGRLDRSFYACYDLEEEV